MQWRKLGANIFMMLSLFVISALRGNGDGKNGAKVLKCSGIDWFLFILLIVISLILIVLAIWDLKHSEAKKIKHKYKFANGDIVCTKGNLTKLIIVGFFVGFFAGALGLGTGTIIQPVFFELGMHPVLAASTGMYIVMYSTLSATIVTILLGKMNIGYMINMLVLVIIASY